METHGAHLLFCSAKKNSTLGRGRICKQELSREGLAEHTSLVQIAGRMRRWRGGMDLIPTFVQDAERLQKEDWRPVMLNAWGLREVDGAADTCYNDFHKYSVGAMFHYILDQKTGRACPDSTVMAAHGTHPVYLKHMLEVGLDREKFKEFSSKVPTFTSRKQFTTLGGGL